MEEKRPWIERTLRRMRESEAELPPARLEDGGEVPYLGERLALRLSRGPRARVTARGGGARRDRARAGRGGRARGARALVPAPRAGGGGARGSTPRRRAPATSYTTLQIRGQRTRWASCSSSGAMSFNWRLLLAPAEILDYVVEHEVAHLEVHDHSAALLDAAGGALPRLARARALAAPPRARAAALAL